MSEEERATITSLQVAIAQLQEQLSTIRLETIEECAKMCENIGKEIVCPEECAEALRALKEVKK
jgi:SpoU rRNA methylase family enzyme